MWRFLTIIIFLTCFQSSLQSALLNLNLTGCSTSHTPGSIQVFLTLSSITVSTTSRGIVTRQLELNWIADQSFPGESVAVYKTDPSQKLAAEPLESVDPSQYPGGYYRSDVELSVVFFNLTSLRNDPCLGYWIAYRDRSGSILSSSCLQIHPFWMQLNSRYLQNLTLPEIMIPGSHDSGSFYFHREREPLSKYKYAQEETIFNQLVYGLRYFDLRIGYYRKTKAKYYINHNFLRTQHSVRSVLRQVHDFITATKEIVILDFHRFPHGFKSDSIHRKLMDFIISTFQSELIPYKDSYENATFSSLWEENKRVLVSYDSPVRDTYYSQYLWPSIYRAWGNKQRPKDLRQYFEEVFKKPTPKGLWASMAELTPNARTIVMHPETGLRVFAEEINRNVTHWFRDLYWHKANIVATDYFMGNDIINVAIEVNKIKGTCPKSTWK